MRSGARPRGPLTGMYPSKCQMISFQQSATLFCWFIPDWTNKRQTGSCWHRRVPCVVLMHLYDRSMYPFFGVPASSSHLLTRQQCQDLFESLICVRRESCNQDCSPTSECCASRPWKRVEKLSSNTFYWKATETLHRVRSFEGLAPGVVANGPESEHQLW